MSDEETAQRIRQLNSITMKFLDACENHSPLDMHRHYLKLEVLFLETLAEAADSVMNRDMILEMASKKALEYEATFALVDARLDEVRKSLEVKGEL